MITARFRSGALAVLVVLLLGFIALNMPSDPVAAQIYDCDSTIAGNQPCPEPTSEPPPPTVQPTATPQLRADLAITSTTPRQRFLTTETNTVSFTLRNNGPNTASNIAVTIGGTTGLRVISTSQTSGTFTVTASSGAGRWNIASLASGAAVTITVTIGSNPTTQAQQSLSGIINVSSPTDPVTTNNRAHNILYFSNLQFNLRMTISLSPTEIPVGGITRVVGTIVNDGPAPAPNVKVKLDTLSGLSYAQFISASTGSWNATSREWELGTMAAGATARIEVGVRADAGTGGRSIQVGWWAQSSNAINELDPNDANYVARFASIVFNCANGIVMRPINYESFMTKVNQSTTLTAEQKTLLRTNPCAAYDPANYRFERAGTLVAGINWTQYVPFTYANWTIDGSTTICTQVIQDYGILVRLAGRDSKIADVSTRQDVCLNNNLNVLFNGRYVNNVTSFGNAATEQKPNNAVVVVRENSFLTDLIFSVSVPNSRSQTEWVSGPDYFGRTYPQASLQIITPVSVTGPLGRVGWGPVGTGNTAGATVTIEDRSLTAAKILEEACYRNSRTSAVGSYACRMIGR